MNHPTSEEWVSYLYGETPAAQNRALKTHLRSCPECRGQLAEFRGGMRHLNAWKLPDAKVQHRCSPIGAGALKWAFAALVVLVAGFAGARLGSTGANPEELRSKMEPQIRKALLEEMAELTRQQASQVAASMLRTADQQAERMAAAYAKALQSQQVENRRELEAIVARLEAQRVADLASLKRELDTLALNTDAGLRHTAEGLVELANYQGTLAPTHSPHSSTQ